MKKNPPKWLMKLVYLKLPMFIMKWMEFQGYWIYDMYLIQMGVIF